MVDPTHSSCSLFSFIAALNLCLTPSNETSCVMCHSSCASAVHSAVILTHVLAPQELKSSLDIDVRVLGIASSTRMLLSEEGINLTTWKADFERCAHTRASEGCLKYSPSSGTALNSSIGSVTACISIIICVHMFAVKYLDVAVSVASLTAH